MTGLEEALATEAGAALGLMTLLLGKHFVFDFLLQSSRQVADKGRYGRLGGLVHAGGHGAGTIAALVAFGHPASVWAPIALAEAALHYHIDWTKEQIVKSAGWTPKQRAFWVAIGVDQLLHGLTYVVIVFATLFAFGR